MALIRDPVLFSAQFGIAPDKLAGLDVFDPTLNADTKLFIDPLLLRTSKHSAINTDGVQAFDTYFGNIIRVLQNSQAVNDLSWRTVDELFTFKEPKETCLGYGDRTTHGSSIGPQLRKRIMETAKEIIRLGVRDPVLFALMGLLEQKIGPDRISDMTTHAIKPAVLKFTEDTLATLSVTTEPFDYDGTQFQLVRNPFEPVRSPVFLLPRDILRPLPVVYDPTGSLQICREYRSCALPDRRRWQDGQEACTSFAAKERAGQSRGSSCPRDCRGRQT